MIKKREVVMHPPGLIQSLLEEMEHDGVIIKVGMRRASTGELQPAYVLTPEYAKRYGNENAIADALIDRYGTKH